MVHRLLFWCLVALCAYIDAQAPPRAVEVQGAWVAALWGAIALVGGWIADKAVTIAITIAQAAWMIGVALWHFAIAVGGVLVNVGSVLAKFWIRVLRPFVTWTWDQLVTLETWVRQTLQPVIDFV